MKPRIVHPFARWLCAALVAFALVAVPPARAASGGDVVDLPTWPQIVERLSCMLVAWVDLGLKGFTIGWGSCSFYMRLDDPGS